MSSANEQGEELKRHVDATLGRGNVYDAVKLPEGEDIREWLAVNTVDLYNAISVLYMTLVEYCTDETCKTMSAGSKVWKYLSLVFFGFLSDMDGIRESAAVVSCALMCCTMRHIIAVPTNIAALIIVEPWMPGRKSTQGQETVVVRSHEA